MKCSVLQITSHLFPFPCFSVPIILLHINLDFICPEITVHSWAGSFQCVLEKSDLAFFFLNTNSDLHCKQLYYLRCPLLLECDSKTPKHYLLKSVLGEMLLRVFLNQGKNLWSSILTGLQGLWGLLMLLSWPVVFSFLRKYQIVLLTHLTLLSL